MSQFRRWNVPLVCRWPWAIALSLVLSSASAWAASDSPKPPGLLSLGLLSVTKGEGFTDKEINTIEEVLLTSFEATGRFKVIGRTDIVALMGLETKKQAVGCTDDTACMAQVAGALGVDLVATADFGRLGSTTIVTLKVILVRTASALKRVRRTVQSNDDLVAAMDSIAAEVAGAVQTGSGRPAGAPTTPPAPESTVRRESPPAAPPSSRSSIARESLRVAPDGQPRTLHLQLGQKFDTAYTIAVTTAEHAMTCPLPLSPTTGCDLRPIDAGELHYTILSGSSVVKDGTFKVPLDGAQLKLIKVRPGWATGLGVTSCVLSGLTGLAGIIYLAAGSAGDGAATTTGISYTLVSAALLGVGIPLLAAIHPLGFVSLDKDDPVVPAP